MATTMDDVRLVRPRHAAELLDVSLRQIDHLVKVGALRPVRLLPGGNRRFRLVDLAALVTADNEEESR
jgi:DNA-binding transcriptional MerR regulator